MIQTIGLMRQFPKYLSIYLLPCGACDLPRPLNHFVLASSCYAIIDTMGYSDVLQNVKMT